MVAASCCAPGVMAVLGAGSCGPRPARSPQLLQQPRQAPRQPRQPLRTLAVKDGGGNGSRTQATTPEQLHATKMINLCLEYFDDLMSKGKAEVCHKILDRGVQHKDMVRNEGRFGVSDYEQYITDLKKAYPDIYVRPTQFGVVDNHTMFVAFEGRATAHTPVFKGVDLFKFNDGATKIKEIEVYRSNWLGAQGHEDRKKQSQQKQRA